MIRGTTLLIFILSSSLMLSAQTFDFNTGCTEAYEQIFELRFEEAKQKLEQEKLADPNNLIPVFLENYIDFLGLFISEEDELLNQTAGNKEKRLSALKKGEKSSPYYLYTQAEVHMQWAFARIKFGEYVKSFLEIRKAYKLLNENAKKFPEFKPNLKSLGILHTLLGAIPDKYKLGAKVLGMQGSIPQGMEELNQVINDETFLFKDEAMIMYALLQLHLNKNESEAWKVINEDALHPKTNLLHCFAASSIAIYTGKNEEAIDLLSNRPSGDQYFDFPFLDFYLANAKLNRLDDDANIYFEKYLKDNKGKNYIKEAHRKLSWYYLLKGKTNKYNYHINMCLLSGHAESDEDKSAWMEAKLGKKPNLKLLKARLLFDGAYYDQAIEVLDAIVEADLKDKEQEVEFNYRRARVMHETDNTETAKVEYINTIKNSEELTLYYAPNACIKLGNIFEKEGNKDKASEYYKKALTFHDHDYQNSISAEAKAGLNRLR